MYTITAIIVTYNPDMRQINATVHSLIKQVSYCIIIDNGNTMFGFQNFENVIVVNLGKNYGIAFAQNKGIDLARQNNADFVLLSDQDTIYPSDFISRMYDAYEQYHGKDSIGAIVPRFYDRNKMQKMRIPIKKFSYIIPDESKIYKVSHAVSSGTVIPIKNLAKIGNMREELFIDWVDFEWCCRATGLGYDIISIPNVWIKHMMGDAIRKIGNKKVAVRSRIRYYYMIRNGIYIICYTNILTALEKFFFGIDLFKKAMGICLIEKHIIQLLFKAFCDGIKKRMYEISGSYK